MLRYKLSSVIIGTVTLLICVSAPANAEFKSKQKQGTIHVAAFGELKVGGVSVTTCAAKEVEGQWHIQKKGQIKKQEQETTEGTRLLIQIKNWGKCETKISGGAGQATQIKSCSISMIQVQTKIATGGVVTPCLARIGEPQNPLCEIQVPAGMETQPEANKGINVGLAEAIFSTALNLKAKVNLTKGGVGGPEGEGLYVESVGKNALCTLPKVTEKAELVGLEMEAENLEAPERVYRVKNIIEYPLSFEIKGTEESIFTFGSGALYEVRCTLAKYNGIIRNRQTTLGVVPAYSICIVFLEEKGEKL